MDSKNETPPKIKTRTVFGLEEHLGCVTLLHYHHLDITIRPFYADISTNFQRVNTFRDFLDHTTTSVTCRGGIATGCRGLRTERT